LDAEKTGQDKNKRNAMLGLSKPYFLGIDFGTSRIKAVELTEKEGRPALVNYAEAEMMPTEGVGASQFGSFEERTAVALKALLAKMRPKADAAHVAMPGFSGLITIIDLPEMNPEELEQAIRFEAHKYVPASLDEVALSWDVVSKKPAAAEGSSDADKAGRMEVLLVAALHKEVEKYERYVGAAGLKMDVLELETFSLARSLVAGREGTYLMIDIGSRATNFVLVERGVIKVNRNLNSGGNEVTVTLSESLNVSWDRAEAMKKGDRDFLNVRESSVVFPALELIGNEALRILGVYRSKNPQANVDAAILSGGASKMKGLDAYLSKSLGVPVEMGDPWKGIAYDERLGPSVDRLGTAYSVAVGLALGGIEAKAAHP
jgi:type IV pilus assembly protein PilM